MGTYDELSVGDRFSTPSVTIDDAMVKELIATGGYTHPLFTDPSYAAATTFGKTPLPGQAILLLLGGLVEQSGRFDETVVALIGIDSVEFLAPAFAGDTLTGEVEVLGKEPSASGKRGTVVMAWRCRNGHGQQLLESTTRMLFNIARNAG